VWVKFFGKIFSAFFFVLISSYLVWADTGLDTFLNEKGVIYLSSTGEDPSLMAYSGVYTRQYLHLYSNLYSGSGSFHIGFYKQGLMEGGIGKSLSMALKNSLDHSAEMNSISKVFVDQRKDIVSIPERLLRKVERYLSHVSSPLEVRKQLDQVTIRIPGQSILLAKQPNVVSALEELVRPMKNSRIQSSSRVDSSDCHVQTGSEIIVCVLKRKEKPNRVKLYSDPI
jgi:hypothetical protein